MLLKMGLSRLQTQARAPVPDRNSAIWKGWQSRLLACIAFFQRFLKRLWLVVALCTALLFPIEAQYPPGQAPIPPGTPPGGVPPGGSGIPIPHRHKNKNKQNSPDASAPTLSVEARTISNDGKKLVAATNDGRTLTMAITPQTKFTRAGNDIDATKIVPRTTIRIEAAEDDEANLSALKVELLKDAPAANASSPGQAENRAANDEEMTRPTILRDPVDVPDRPILKRGKPVKSSSHEDDSAEEASSTKSEDTTRSEAGSAKNKDGSVDFTIDGDAAPTKRVNSPSEQLVEKTKNWAATFTNGLPNYVCSQMTTRYVQQSKATGWEPLDVITAKVIYEDGKESYKEITVGGKRTNKSMMELGGTTSTGEFASTLHSLFSDASQAEFKLYETTTISGIAAKVYDFKVALKNSDWFINVGGQSLRPAYSGSVWIDPATAQVRRIEMQADNIPKDFPLDSLEWAVDYDNVSLGTSTFLLPVHAANLACQRGTTICTKNTEDFRDYHKFSGESTIVYK